VKEIATGRRRRSRQKKAQSRQQRYDSSVNGYAPIYHLELNHDASQLRSKKDVESPRGTRESSYMARYG
jgi:hypothetical protein